MSSQLQQRNIMNKKRGLVIPMPSEKLVTILHSEKNGEDEVKKRTSDALSRSNNNNKIPNQIIQFRDDACKLFCLFFSRSVSRPDHVFASEFLFPLTSFLFYSHVLYL